MKAINATGAQQGILVLEFTKSAHAIPWLKENDGFRVPESNNFTQKQVVEIIAGKLEMNPDGRDKSPIEKVEIYKFTTSGKGVDQRLDVPLKIQQRLRNYIDSQIHIAVSHEVDEINIAALISLIE